MIDYNKIDLITIVECYAESEGNISSEWEFSDSFDGWVAETFACGECGSPGPIVKDADLLQQEFSAYKDRLCDDGLIHPTQVTEYEYVGKHDD